MLHSLSHRGIFLAALLFSLIGLIATSPKAEAASSFQTGVLDADAFQVGSDEAFDRAAASGATFIKNNVYWTYLIEDGESSTRPGTEARPFDPTDPGSSYYNWNTYDRIVRKAAARGLEVIFAVVAAPRWARDPSCASLGICTPKPEDYADFATAAASRYSGTFDPGNGQGVLPRVRHWQALVEPNLDLFYKPVFKPNGAPASPYTFRVALNHFYDAVHAVNPDNFVIAGGLAPNSVKDRAIGPLTFTRLALCMNGNFQNPRPVQGCNFRVKADAWAVHPYTTGSPIHMPRKADSMTVAALPRMAKMLEAANKANRLVSKSGKTQLWATEFSWDSRPPDPGGVPSALLSRWVSQAMYLMFKANVRQMIWFGLRDQARTPGQKWTDSFESGLYRRANNIANDKPKPFLKAFRQPFYAERTKSGFRFWGRTANSKPAQIDIFGRRKASGRFGRVTTVRANANGMFAGSIRRKGFTNRGAVYSKPRGGQASIAFGLWKTKNCHQPPFGGTKLNRECLGRG